MTTNGPCDKEFVTAIRNKIPGDRVVQKKKKPPRRARAARTTTTRVRVTTVIARRRRRRPAGRAFRPLDRGPFHDLPSTCTRELTLRHPYSHFVVSCRVCGIRGQRNGKPDDAGDITHTRCLYTVEIRSTFFLCVCATRRDEVLKEASLKTQLRTQTRLEKNETTLSLLETYLGKQHGAPGVRGCSGSTCFWAGLCTGTCRRQFPAGTHIRTAGVFFEGVVSLPPCRERSAGKTACPAAQYVTRMRTSRAGRTAGRRSTTVANAVLEAARRRTEFPAA